MEGSLPFKVESFILGVNWLNTQVKDMQWISSKLFLFCFRLCVVLFTKQGHQAKEKLVLRLLAKDKEYQRDHRVQFLYLYEDVQKEVIQELNEGLKDDRCTDNSTAAKVNVLFSFSYAG